MAAQSSPHPRPSIGRRKIAEALFKVLGLCSLAIGVGTLVLLFGALLVEGVTRIDWQFLMSFPSRHAAKAGILPAWVGSTLIMLVTAVVGVPLGVAAAIYLEEYARRTWMTELIEVTVTNLAGVPSIIYGLLALGLFVYILGLGENILVAGLTLALLILPVVIVTTREAIRAIPVEIREAAYALGATKWQTVAHHVLPYSAAGILTGIILALSRAIGETAPIVTIGALTFIAFLPPAPITTHPPYVSFDWLLSPFTVMPIQMFGWVSRPGEDFASNAAAAGVLLVGMTLAMNGVAIYLRYRMRKQVTW
ncbi:MAG: phosphate ABC transporter permease PstA [Nitrospirae bacterium]|nr:phosphate ABC transporter permease PstA [Nitrospirota bacterium]MBU6481526.1 phosphate ABC transporter permease PstA [Nitrospirota bacterium]MDE3040428.1 phosphate ABC transporter permease PstA [Nitrospirota bacterium]MDE3050489.1 phosphate ABC transporter permease PstA [Nitrospirota bacterium]MDE3220532.1 phosphate ABC transporter permease PstA [Nitrospirota bacterium]